MTHARACTCCGGDGNVCEGLGPGLQICIEMSFSGIKKNQWKKGDGCEFGHCAVGYFGPGGIVVGLQEIQNLSGVNITTVPGLSIGNCHMKVVGGSACEYTGVEFQSNEVASNARTSCHPDGLHLSNVSQGIAPGQTFNWQGDVIIRAGESVTVQNQLECGPIVGLGHMSDGGGSCTVTARIVNFGDCTANNDSYTVAQRCSGGQEISVDLETNVDGKYAVRYQGELYALTSQQTNGQPVDVEWVNESCSNDPPVGENRIARACTNSSQTIVYDPDLAPANARTCLWAGRRYELTGEESDSEAQPVLFSISPCLVLGTCSQVTGANDPRCNLPEFAHCPQCFDGTQVDPPVGPNTSQAADDEPDIPFFNAGSILKSAIRFATLNKLDDCPSCERRKKVMDHYGQKVGRWIIKRMKW